jgi:hypothetical protein
LDVATGEYLRRVPLGQVDELEKKKGPPRTGRQNLPTNAHAKPMTFAGRDGRQYVVIAAGGGGFWRKLSSRLSDELIAFARPR